MCDVHLEAHKEAQKRYRLKRKAESEENQDFPVSDEEEPQKTTRGKKVPFSKDSAPNVRTENPISVRQPKKSRLHSFSQSGASIGGTIKNSDTDLHEHADMETAQTTNSETQNLELTKSVTGSKTFEKSAVGEHEVLKEEITEWYEDVVKPDGSIINVKKITREVEKGKRVQQDSESLQTSATAKVELERSSYQAQIALRETRIQAILERRREEQQQAEIYEMMQQDYKDEDDGDEYLEFDEEEEDIQQDFPEEEYDSEVEIQRQKEERAAKRQKREEWVRDKSLFVVLEPGQPIPEEHPDDVPFTNHPLELFKTRYWEENKHKYRDGVTAEILWDALPRDERVYPEYPKDKNMYKSTYSAMEYGRCMTEHRMKEKKIPRTCYFSYRDRPGVIVSTLDSKWDPFLWGHTYTPDAWKPEVISLQYKRGVLDPSLVPKEKWDRHLIQCWLDRDEASTTAQLDPRLESVDKIVVHFVPKIKDKKRLAVINSFNVLAGACPIKNEDVRIEYAMCRFERGPGLGENAKVPHSIPVLTSFLKAKPHWRKKLPETPLKPDPIQPSLLNEKPLWTYLLKQ